MCDDICDDWDGLDGLADDNCDPDNDYDGDFVEDATGEWYEDDENLIDESEINPPDIQPDNCSTPFNQSNAVILGMLTGAVYEFSIDKNNLSKLIIQASNKKK